jgi:hypothetical protein
MIPVRVIGFKATGKDEVGKDYDCSFMVSFPANQKIEQRQLDDTIQFAIAQFQEYHPTGNITAKMENVVLARQG